MNCWLLVLIYELWRRRDNAAMLDIIKRRGRYTQKNGKNIERYQRSCYCTRDRCFTFVSSQRLRRMRGARAPVRETVGLAPKLGAAPSIFSTACLSPVDCLSISDSTRWCCTISLIVNNHTTTNNKIRRKYIGNPSYPEDIQLVAVVLSTHREK
jgi:hypothetical protein